MTPDEVAKRVHVLDVTHEQAAALRRIQEGSDGPRAAWGDRVLDEAWEALRGRVVHWGPMSGRELKAIGWDDVDWCRDADEGLALGLSARSVEAVVDADLSSLAGPTRAEMRAIVGNALARMPERR